MSALVEPLRLVLLAEQPEWAVLLRTRLAALGNAYPLITAPSWEAACSLFDDPYSGLLLTTPACQPEAGRCPLPVVLLLDEEPEQAPPDVYDWLVRDRLSVDLLRRCLRYARERSQLQGTLQRLAEQDPLTGIANRQGFHTLLAAHLAEYHGRGLSLGHLDLDNFKHVNDALGHQAGDRLILQVVSRLKAQLDAGDRLARLGSDEFALLLDTRRDPQRAEQIAERISEALSEPYWLDGESLLLGSSLGIAHSRADAGADPLMWHAHIAMQQAKSSQGCTFHVFDERINRGARSLADLESELRRALRRDELELHYQPRLCLQSGRIVGLEALVRWRHPERGLLAPDEFVPLAEESGLIVPLGYWVISRALRDMQWLRGRGLPALHMAINLSFRQFQDSQLLSTLQR
ncbi:MAG: diguanylate cyclase, partial [Pseudomonas sp.]